MFDLATAQTGYGWLKDLHDMTMREVSQPPNLTSSSGFLPDTLQGQRKEQNHSQAGDGRVQRAQLCLRS